MRPILRILAIASTFAIATSGVALAQEHAPRQGWGQTGGMGMQGGRWGQTGMFGADGGLLRAGGRLAEELDLSDVQRDKLQAIRDGLARKQIQTRADLAIARLDLTKLMRADAPSQSDVDAKVNTITRLQGDMMKASLAARIDARRVLTAEQRKKLEDLKSQRMRGDGRGRGSRGDEN